MIKILNNLDIKKIVDIAISAGEIATTAFYEKNYEIKIKEDGSKVTSIDLELSFFIKENLQKIFKGIAVVCEEGDKNNSNENLFFLIDPIDGTSSFINQENQFTINIALIKNQQVIFGLIYAPLFEGGKMIFNDEKNQVWLYHLEFNNEQILSKREILQTKPNHFLIITSKKTKDEQIANFIEQTCHNFTTFEIEKYSSAVKFIVMAQNRADLYLHFRRSMEWDIAPGVFLLSLLNAKSKTIEFVEQKFIIGDEITFCKKNFINPWFIISYNFL